MTVRLSRIGILFMTYDGYEVGNEVEIKIGSVAEVLFDTEKTEVQ